MSATPQATPGHAIALMLLAILSLSLMDACVKTVSTSIGVFPALWARYTGQLAVVVILIAPRLRQVVHTHFLKAQLARSFLLLLSTVCFFNGLARVELAQATAVLVMNPLFITLGATLFLGEPLGIRRLVAIAIAFVGALMVIQPGASFEPAILLPLIAAVSVSGYMLVTRSLGTREDPWTSLFYTALFGGILMMVLAPMLWVWPSRQDAAWMAGIAVFGTLGQLLLIKAFSQAQAGLLAPYGYSGVVFATAIGVVMFGEIPGWLTICGTLVIVTAGIYVWARETRQKAPA